MALFENGLHGESNSGKLWRFDAYEVDSSNMEVRKHGHRLKLSGQPFDVLLLLLQRSGELVTRDELRTSLWPKDIHVDFEHSLNTIVKKLRRTLDDNPEQPKYIETVPRKGYRFIANIAVIERSEAVESATAPPAPPAAETLESSLVPSPHSPHLVSSSVLSRRLRWKLAAAVVLVIIVFSIALAVTQKRKVRHETRNADNVTRPTSYSRPSIAVLGFQNVSPDRSRDWLSTAFSQMLATELERGGKVRTVPQDLVARTKRDLAITDADGFTRNVLRSVRNNLGTDYVVAGSYVALGSKGSSHVRLDLRLQETLSGETLASIAVNGQQSEIFELVVRAGDELRAKIGGAIPPEGDVDWRTVVPSDPDAARLYSEGLAHLRRSENLSASGLLQRAVSIEPSFALGHAALAEAWQALGYNSRALEAARKAFSFATALPEDERLKIQARYYELQSDWAGAIGAYRHLCQDFPEDIDSALRLVEVEVAAGNSSDASATISNLRALPAGIADDPRIDLAEASIAAQNSDFKRQRELAEQAAHKAARIGARLLVARAKLIEGWAYDDLSQFAQALQAYSAAQQAFDQTGDIGGAATALNDIGIVLQKQGDLAGAHEKLDRAQQLFRQLGDENGWAAALTNLGDVDRAEGKLSDAEERFRAALAIARKTGRKDREYVAINNLGGVLFQRGDFFSAKTMFDNLLQARQAIGDKAGIAFAKTNLADVLRVQGDLERSIALHSEAVASFRQLGDRNSLASVEISLAKAQIAQQDFDSAKRTLEEAIAINEQIGAKGDTALARVLLTKVALEQRKVSASDGAFEKAVEELRNERRQADEIEALAIEIRAHVQAGNLEGANTALKRAVAIPYGDWLSKFHLALAQAQVNSALGNKDAARRQLATAKAGALRVGCELCAIEVHSVSLQARGQKSSTILEGKVVMP
jgi:DNA-binding winged helix-turn-helix (wHTH) protein/tetratricopeptide (TPR) repeat protein/TolB-like protein